MTGCSGSHERGGAPGTPAGSTLSRIRETATTQSNRAHPVQLRSFVITIEAMDALTDAVWPLLTSLGLLDDEHGLADRLGGDGRELDLSLLS